MRDLGARIGRAYRALALLGLNTIVVLVLLNVLAYLAMVMSVREVTPEAKYGNDLMRRAYPEWSPEELGRLMTESYQPLVFEAYTHFRDRPVRGKYVNVDPNGFRFVRDQGPWPIRPENFNVFFFGGSTAFGYGLPDDQTVPSYLQEILVSRLRGRRAFVYNFGRGYYINTQERIALEQLLTRGNVPDVAVFLDGLNDFLLPEGDPEGAARWAAAVEGGDARRQGNYLGKLPAVQVAQRILGRLAAPPAPPAAPRILGAAALQPDAVRAERVIERWLASKAILEAIAARFGFALLFVWQPVAAYGFDVTYHPFFGGEVPEKYRLVKVGYVMLRERMKTGTEGDVLWLGDLQRGREELLYVDQVHYNAKFSREIAESIARRILQRERQDPISTGPGGRRPSHRGHD